MNAISKKHRTSRSPNCNSIPVTIDMAAAVVIAFNLHIRAGSGRRLRKALLANIVTAVGKKFEAAANGYVDLGNLTIDVDGEAQMQALSEAAFNAAGTPFFIFDLMEIAAILTAGQHRRKEAMVMGLLHRVMDGAAYHACGSVRNATRHALTRGRQFDSVIVL
jgi:hypothetical protein